MSDYNESIQKLFKGLGINISDPEKIKEILPDIGLAISKSMNHDLIKIYIENKLPIHMNNYEFVLDLVDNSMLNLLIEIEKNYFGNMESKEVINIVKKICERAIYEGKVDVLKHYLTTEVFDSVPDIMFMYFLGAVEYSNDLSVIKFFIEMGMDIRQQNCRVINRAEELEKIHMVNYFKSLLIKSN